MEDIAKYNQQAWDHLVKHENEWTRPVSSQQIDNARHGNWTVVLTPSKPVHEAWFGTLKGKKVLCLASGGGQQGPILAAAGADVTVYDMSENQLNQDRMVATRDQLNMHLIQGDMRDLSQFEDQSFDLIFHPCSNGFIPDIQPVWNECSRVLKVGGELLSGFANPAVYIFDYDKGAEGEVFVRHKLPYSDETHLSEEELIQLKQSREPMSFSHSLEQQIGGQLKAGLTLIDLFEDGWPGLAFSDYLPVMLATRSRKAFQ